MGTCSAGLALARAKEAVDPGRAGGKIRVRNQHARMLPATFREVICPDLELVFHFPWSFGTPIIVPAAVRSSSWFRSGVQRYFRLPRGKASLVSGLTGVSVTVPS